MSLLTAADHPYRTLMQSGLMQSAGEARDVGVRYCPPQPGGHVEAYVLQASDPISRSALYVEASIFASQRPPYRALAAALAVFFDREKGHVAVRAQVPFDPACFDRNALDVQVRHQGHAPLLVLRRDRSLGEVSSGERTVGWDLSLSRRGASLPLLDRRLAGLTRMAVRSTGRANLILSAPDLRLSGSVTVNGVARSVDNWTGFLAHGWSPSTPRTFAWGHCSAWEPGPSSPTSRASSAPGGAPELVLQGLSVGRSTLSPLASFAPLPSLGRPMTLLSLRYRGVDHVVRSPLEVAAARAELSPRRWKFRGRAGLLRVEGELWAETDDFVGLFAQNPNGTMGHLLVSALARARVSVTPPEGAPFLARSKAATLILGTSEPHHGVRMYV